MNWIISILIITILILIYSRQRSKTKREQYLTKLRSDWGKPKETPQYNFDLISSYHLSTLNNSVFQNISDTTNQDLDLDDVFTFLDRTTSAIGQQYLYHKLHCIKGQSEVRELDDSIDFFIKNEHERLQVQLLLSSLNHKNVYYYHSLFTSDNTITNNKLKLAYILNTCMLISLGLNFINLLWLLPVILIFCINLVFHYKNKYAQYDQLNATQYFKQVHHTINKLHAFKKLSKTVDFEKTKKATDKLKALYNLTHIFNSDNMFKDEISTLVWLPIEWIKIMLNIELISFQLFLNKAKNSKKELTEVFESIAKIDVSISIASLSINNMLSKPTFSTTKELLIEDLTHPLIENCITNNIHLENESLLLTGSNMAGKTTLIRALTLNAILAQTIGYVFATKYKAPFSQISTSIRITDNLNENTSYYLQEVKELKNFIEQSKKTEPQIFVLDEILKGTNTLERISSAYAILKYINTANAIVIVSTHDLELIDLLQTHNYSCQYLQESIINNELHFDYKLKQGKPESTNAIKILELNEFPKEVTALAYKTKKMFS
ncbi:MutS-related protein [Myroides sp.]|uniref:MutS-related protein n=1 Tax=Myroides sp. TaxID=1874736 RepID=UPI003F2E09B5